MLRLRVGGDGLGVRRAEEAQFGSHRHLVEEDRFLGVGVLGQDQQGLGLECGQLVRIGGLGGGGDPTLVFAEQVPDGVEQLGLHAFEIEVDDDDRPARAIVIGERFFDDGAHAFEEIIAQGGFGAGGLGVVRDYGPALAGGWVDGPTEILLDAHGEARLERAIDAVAEVALVGVAVVRVQHGTVVIEEIEIRLAKQGQRRQGEKQNSHQTAGYLMRITFRLPGGGSLDAVNLELGDLLRGEAAHAGGLQIPQVVATHAVDLQVDQFLRGEVVALTAACRE